MMKDFTIQPLKGYGEIPFGMTLDETVKLLNMPDFYEELSDMEETGNRSIYYEYDSIQTNIYFEGSGMRIFMLPASLVLSAPAQFQAQAQAPCR